MRSRNERTTRERPSEGYESVYKSEDERCEPCELAIGFAEVVTECKLDEVDQYLQRFLEGKLTLRDLHRQIKCDQGVLERIKTVVDVDAVFNPPNQKGD